MPYAPAQSMRVNQTEILRFRVITDGVPDPATVVSASSNAPSVVDAVMQPDGRSVLLRALAVGGATVTLAGPTGSQALVVSVGVAAAPVVVVEFVSADPPA